jgi:glycosyltransferase involved in cell wall biosynthesis
MMFSVVIPVYKSANTIQELVERIKKSFIHISNDYEIILVEDGCPQNSWALIVEECAVDTRVVGLKLSRNFGQHYAITAGLENATGQWVVVMDCDLQDIPEEIPNLYAKVIQGYDYIQARRSMRKDGFFKKMSSKLFHAVYSYLADFKSDSSVANFGIYNQKVIKAILSYSENSRSFPSLLRITGFKNAYLDVTHSKRLHGSSSYTLSKLIDLSLDVILSNSNKPLKLTVKFGFLISLISFLLAIYNLIAHWLGIINVKGYTSTIFSIWFVGGILLFVLGILGLYIGKIFEEVKARPLYIIDEKLNK